MEKFADHYQTSNGCPFADVDSAYTLAFAVTMLNTDQHNKNHTRINEPMTIDQFKRNLRGTNGGSDFDQDMLTEIYQVCTLRFWSYIGDTHSYRSTST